MNNYVLLTDKFLGVIKPNLTYLETIAGGDKSFIDSILNLFVANTYPELENIKRLAIDHNWEELGNTAHKIKAPIQMLGVQTISDLVIEIEQMGKQGKNTELAQSKVSELEQLLLQLREGIELYLNESK